MSCYAVEDPTFQPAMRLISAITNANPAAVTTTFDHDYETGLIVRLVLPIAVGMGEAADKVGEITVTGTDTFTIDIDTRLFNAFSIPGSPAPYVNVCALVVPVGEDTDTLSSATRNTL